jgi:hypothetical protein
MKNASILVADKKEETKQDQSIPDISLFIKEDHVDTFEIEFNLEQSSAFNLA